jgi:hypothetical protein
MIKVTLVTVVALLFCPGAQASQPHSGVHTPAASAPRKEANTSGVEAQLAALSNQVKATGNNVTQSIAALEPRLDKLADAAQLDAAQSPAEKFLSSKAFTSIVSFCSLLAGLYVGIFAGPRIANRMEGKRSSRKAAIDFWNETLDRQASVDDAYRFLDTPERLTTAQTVTIRVVHDWFDGMTTLAADPYLLDATILKKLGVAVPMRDFMEKLKSAHDKAAIMAADTQVAQAERDAARAAADFMSHLLQSSSEIDSFLKSP